MSESASSPNDYSPAFVQLYLQSCMLRCTTSSNCVRGCELASLRPTESAATALNILRLEDSEAFSNMKQEVRAQARNRVLSIGKAMERACFSECGEYCKTSSIDRDSDRQTCWSQCNDGCSHFVKPLLSLKGSSQD